MTAADCERARRAGASRVAGLLAGLLVLGLALVSPVAAQQAPMAKDLEFPSAPVQLSEFAVPQMVLLKPDGPGPFPALVLHHQCGGLRRGQWHNQSMRDWAVKAVNRGYVVLLIDSLGPRNVDWVCGGPRGGVNLGRGVRDALQGANHLRKFPFVDAGRIAHVGYSWGAMVGLLANSTSFRYFMESSANFAAYVSFYPGCFTVKRPDGSPLDIVRSDIDSRHLVLMGDKDTETPADECAARLVRGKSRGCAGRMGNLHGCHALLGLREPGRIIQGRHARQSRELPLRCRSYARCGSAHVRLS